MKADENAHQAHNCLCDPGYKALPLSEIPGYSEISLATSGAVKYFSIG